MQQEDPLSHLPMPAGSIPYRPRLLSIIRDRVTDLDQHVLPLLSEAGDRNPERDRKCAVRDSDPDSQFLLPERRSRDAGGHRRDCGRPASASVVDDIFSDLAPVARPVHSRAGDSVAGDLVFYFAFLFAARACPYPILLAGIAAILEFIPLVGPLTASVVIVLVAAFTGYPHLLWIVIFLVVYRIFQDYVLSPYLMSSGVEIHPMLVLFGVLAGEQLAGIPGMFFSVPVMAALRVICVRLREGRRALAQSRRPAPGESRLCGPTS